MRSAVRIGTSGWEYRHWAGRFYPRGMPRDEWLAFYASEFDTVELNNPFYRLPEASVFEGWARRVPDRFRYAVKASRYLTHRRKLREPAEPLERLWTRAGRLRQKLGPVLYQLPPRWKPNPDRLETFLEQVPSDRDQALELRDRRWYQQRILELLARSPVSLCLHDMPGSAAPRKPVGSIVYIRFHGSGARYGGAYSSQLLSAWADRICDWASDGRPVWAYFNNDAEAHAVRDAQRLREMVARR